MTLRSAIMIYNIYQGDDAKLRTYFNISEALIKETDSIYSTKSKSEMVEMALKDVFGLKSCKN